VGFNAIPKATLVPVIALIFIGQHDFNTVLMAFLISFFPIAVSVGIGLSTLEPEYRDILRALGAAASRLSGSGPQIPPQTFADLIGQEAMVRTLKNAFAADRIAHAFMMTGIRGTGKTTTARIIAKGLNCIGPDGRAAPRPNPAASATPAAPSPKAAMST
jgi:hypothetical protein